MAASRPRRSAPDTLRGLSLLSMGLYHTCWDMVYLFHRPWGWYRSFGAYVWQQSICWSFILLSGWCLSLGRHNVRRGLTVCLAGAGVSLVSAAAVPEAPVRFGILTFLGTAGLLTTALSPLLRKIPPRLGLGAGFALFTVFKDVSDGYLGFAWQSVVPLPPGLYADRLTAFLGFPPGGFSSSDYFPLLPWIFLYWCGYFLYRLTPEDGLTLPRLPYITALGRHSLWAYLLHQPLIYGALSLALA